jgi:hypothetical protein
MKRFTARTHRGKVRRRRWRQSWTVMLEWIGDKAGVLPLIEHLFQAPSDGSGTILACGLNDATWTRYTKTEALGLFNCLKHLGRVRFSPYVRVQLFHDFEDVPIQFGPGGTIAMSELGKGTKRIAVYRRGKPPDFKRLIRKRRA